MPQLRWKKNEETKDVFYELLEQLIAEVETETLTQKETLLNCV